jgi:hypothetical protein
MNEPEEIEYTEENCDHLYWRAVKRYLSHWPFVVPRPWNYRIDNGNELVLQDMFGDSLARFKIFGPPGRERLKWIADDSDSE